jgi:hypothetical protein
MSAGNLRPSAAGTPLAHHRHSKGSDALDVTVPPIGPGPYVPMGSVTEVPVGRDVDKIRSATV